MDDMQKARGEGFDLAVAALRGWAAGFSEGATAPAWLIAAAVDLETHREAILNLSGQSEKSS